MIASSLMLEKSFYGFCQDYSVVNSEITTNSRVTRLNGIAGFVQPQYSTEFSQSYFPYGYIEFVCHPNEVTIYDIIRLHKLFLTKDISTRLRPKIEFAWEHMNIEGEIQPAIAGSETLVVIGYSFPFFNRKTDEALIGLAAESLQQVYLQTNGDIGSKSRLMTILSHLGMSSIQIHEIAETDFFLIPNELQI